MSSTNEDAAHRTAPALQPTGNLGPKRRSNKTNCSTQLSNLDVERFPSDVEITVDSTVQNRPIVATLSTVDGLQISNAESSSSYASNTTRRHSRPVSDRRGNFDSHEAKDNVTNPSALSSELYLPERRRAAACEALRSALPSYDAIMSVFTKTGNNWWKSFRQKTQAITYETPVEALPVFAAHTYTSTNPSKLGILATAYARSHSQSDYLYDLVEKTIISDSFHATTLDGLECLILLAKTYSDIGHPQRSWVMWRRGIALALLMNLHQESHGEGAGFSKGHRIWLAIYHGDRFTSLLLGLPHGFNDAFLRARSGTLPAPLHLIQGCAFVAGKVIERNVLSTEPSFGLSMLLDEEMKGLRQALAEDWWEVPNALPTFSAELDELQERLLQQFFYFHILMYIHLPFLVYSADQLHDISKISCKRAAKELLRRYRLLRTEIENNSLFDCKTSDFVAFTAAVVLYITIYSPNSKQHASAEDLALMEEVETIFEREEKKRGCKIAAQCLRTLLLLSNRGSGRSDQLTEVSIPHFGIIIKRKHDVGHGNEVEVIEYPVSVSEPHAATVTTPLPSSCFPETVLEYTGFGLSSPAAHDMFMDDENFFWADEISSWIDISFEQDSGGTFMQY